MSALRGEKGADDPEKCPTGKGGQREEGRILASCRALRETKIGRHVAAPQYWSLRRPALSRGSLHGGVKLSDPNLEGRRGRDVTQRAPGRAANTCESPRESTRGRRRRRRSSLSPGTGPPALCPGARQASSETEMVEVASTAAASAAVLHGACLQHQPEGTAGQGAAFSSVGAAFSSVGAAFSSVGAASYRRAAQLQNERKQRSRTSRMGSGWDSETDTNSFRSFRLGSGAETGVSSLSTSGMSWVGSVDSDDEYAKASTIDKIGRDNTSSFRVTLTPPTSPKRTPSRGKSPIKPRQCHHCDKIFYGDDGGKRLFCSGECMWSFKADVQAAQLENIEGIEFVAGSI